MDFQCAGLFVSTFIFWCNQAVEVVDNQEEEVMLAVWCDNEDLDWNNDPKENQEEANDGDHADGLARRNNPDNLEETGDGGGVARMNQELQIPRGNQQVNMWRRGVVPVINQYWASKIHVLGALFYG